MYTLAYTLIKQRLIAISGIKKVEWYTGQERGEGSLKNAPAVLVEFLPSEMQRVGNIQRGEVEFRLHLVTTTMLSNDKHIQNDDNKDHMYLLDSVFNATQSKKGMLSHIVGHEAKKGTDDDLLLFNSPNRNHIEPPHAQKRLMVSIQKFKAMCYDYSGTKTYQEVTPDLEVTET
ncbi:hypothetical protein [Reichenbachiella sp.]|uniref:hypothetical protein n=1 Tax=Reichenbachiella sp. TaxID=2184521 RepID=UPI003B5C3E01